MDTSKKAAKIIAEGLLEIPVERRSLAFKMILDGLHPDLYSFVLTRSHALQSAGFTKIAAIQQALTEGLTNAFSDTPDTLSGFSIKGIVKAAVNPIEATKKTVSAVKTATKATGSALKTATKATGGALKTAAEKVADAFIKVSFCNPFSQTTGTAVTNVYTFGQGGAPATAAINKYICKKPEGVSENIQATIQAAVKSKYFVPVAATVGGGLLLLMVLPKRKKGQIAQ